MIAHGAGPFKGPSIRAHSSWLAWTTLPRPRLLSSPEIGARLATAIGTGMYNFNVQSSHSMSWGSAHAAWALDSLTMRVLVIIEFKCIDPVFGDGGCSDSVVEFSADLRFSCSPAGVIVVTKVHDNAFNMGGAENGVTGHPAEGSEMRQHVGPRMVDAFRNVTVPNCAPIVVHPVSSGTGINVEVEL